MKVVVLGATGGTGLEIVRAALYRSHSVTALVRSPEKLNGFRDRISVIQGDLLNSVELERAIRDHDAVISGFGPRIPIAKGDRDLLQRFAQALRSAMMVTGVSRVVVESVAFLFKNTLFPPVYLLGRLFFPAVVADASAMERIFAESPLEWTMVRPPELTDAPYTGQYRFTEGRLPKFGFKVSRADVADYMVRALEIPESVGKVVGVAS